MFGLSKVVVLSTLLCGALSSPTQPKDESIIDWDSFEALLDSIDTSAIHHALHSLSPKFKDGVFSKDRSAIEMVHSENPAIASKLVHIAKRQTSTNGTTTVVAPSPSTPSQSSAFSQSSVQSVSRAASVSSALSSAIHASTVPSPTTILVAPITPSSATPVATSDGHVVFSSYGGGLVTLTSSAQKVSFTPSTSLHLFYTTLPDGQVETSTSVIVVNAPVTQGAGAQAATATGAAASSSTGSPGLQSGAARPTRGFLTEIVLMLGGAAAFAMVL